MSAKTISIRRDLYEIPNSTRGETESFSNVLERLVKEKNANLSEFFGVLSACRKIKQQSYSVTIHISGIRVIRLFVIS